MEMKPGFLLLCSAVLVLSPASSFVFEDEKNYYSHEPIPNYPPQHGTPVSCGTPTQGIPTPVTVNPPIVTTPTPTPVVVNPPIVTTPTTPVIAPYTPTTPVQPSPPFTCIFWKNHPSMVWGLAGWLGTLSNAFGIPTVPGFSHNANLMEALSNPRSDGYGELYREGTASLLNSMVHGRFPYTTSQVRESFIAALGSNQEAEAQARVFKMANEGRTGY